MKKVIIIALLASTMLSISACIGGVNAGDSTPATKSDKEIAADILIALINNDKGDYLSSKSSIYNLNSRSDVIKAYQQIYSAIQSVE